MLSSPFSLTIIFLFTLLVGSHSQSFLFKEALPHTMPLQLHSQLQNLQLSTNGTEGYYLSPHALGKQVEVSQALMEIASQFKIQKTIYTHAEKNYTISNFTLDLDYNDGRQIIQIADHEEVSVSGGRIFFGYRFNFSVNHLGQEITGGAHGSVYSDSLSYKKILRINQEGHLEWALAKDDGFNELTIHDNRMKIKRMDPYDEETLSVLEEMLDRAFQNISPSNLQHQILENFNALFPKALNDSLNHEVFGNTINYKYHHSYKGELEMNIVHRLWDFQVDKVQGYKIIFVTEIQGHEKDTTCDITVPNEHRSFQIYGGIQNIHLNCLYQDVVNYLQAQGWLDTHLNADWEVSAFQFYAGDLFDLMNSLYTRVNPRAILEGDCKATPNNLELKQSRQFDSNMYRLDVQYNCSVKTTDKTAGTLQILQFTAETRFYIKAYADKLALNFEVAQAQVLSLTFIPVNNLVVTNLNLAFFKASQVVEKMVNQKVFGTGFPSIPRYSPRTSVNKEWVIYYDTSAVEDNNNLKIFNEQ